MAIFVFLLVAILFGLNGISVAKNKNISRLTGFLYGFSLGPFGLIIVALLNPKNDRDLDMYRKLPESQRNLDHETYRIYLVKKYFIEKNEILDAFVCDGRLFNSADEVIKFAHEKHQHNEKWAGQSIF